MARLILRPPRVARRTRQGSTLEEVLQERDLARRSIRDKGPGAFPRPDLPTSVLLALRMCPTRRADFGEDVSRITKSLVDVRHDFDHLADQSAGAVLDDLGDEIGSDRLPVLVEADLAVRRVDRERRQRGLKFRLVVAEVAVDLI